MQIHIEDRPVNTISTQALLLFFSPQDQPFSGPIGKIDWCLSGRLSKFLCEKKIMGEAGEVMMIPGQGRVKAEVLLLFGLGEGEKLEKIRFRILQTLEDMGFKEIAVLLLKGDEKELNFWQSIGEELHLERLVFVPSGPLTKEARERIQITPSLI